MLPNRIEKKHRVTNKEGMRENNFQTIIIIHFPDLSSLFEDLPVLNLVEPSEFAGWKVVAALVEMKTKCSE